MCGGRLSANMTPMTETTITLRPAAAADADALELLAELDSSRAPRGDVLVAEVEGTIWAAMSADDGHTVANPFRPTLDLVQLLRQRVGSAPRDRLLPARREAHGRRARGARRAAGLLRA
jgi:hypothetical protein